VTLPEIKPLGRHKVRLAQELLPYRGMKRVAFKLHPGKGGWLRTTIAPLNHKQEGRFGTLDMFMFFALVAVIVAVARVFIAR
jgi:hypothetical protein